MSENMVERVARVMAPNLWLPFNRELHGSPPNQKAAQANMMRLAGLALNAMKALKTKCSCMDVYGEDPKCAIHGIGTDWAEANPDPCDSDDAALAGSDG